MLDSSPFARCDSCYKRLWKDRCYNSRCSENSTFHLKRHAYRIRENLNLFDGDVALLTVTAPGSDLLPWDGKTVRSEHAWSWNYSLWDRWPKLRDVASRFASRHVKGVRSGILVVVPEMQSRGVLHLHIVLGAESVLERRWAEAFVSSVRKNATLHLFGRQVDFHRSSWGPVRDRAVASYVSKLGTYLTKSLSLRKLWEGYDLPGRAFYVSRRLTDKTGLTVRMLRRSTSVWFRYRISLPSRCVSDWVEYERSFSRPLNIRELSCLSTS